MGNILFLLLHVCAVLFAPIALILTIPLHLIFAAVMGSVRKAQGEKTERRRAEAGRSREHRICPHCAEVVRREATTCKHCGKDLPPAPPVRSWIDTL